MFEYKKIKNNMEFPSTKNDFGTDYLDAKKYENLALEYYKNIKHLNIVENLNKEDLKFFDLIVYDKNGEIDCYIEVKHDKYVALNNHLAVEYECSGIPSGIETTKAEKFIFISSEPLSAQHIMYVFKTKELREFIINNEGKRHSDTCLMIQYGTVRNKTKGKFYRIDLKYLENIYEEIDVTKYIECGLITNPDL